MRKFGLIGFPLGHSFSRKYFTEKFTREKISDAQYENFPIESIDLFPDIIKNEPDLCGLNVTIPYKQEIIKYLDILDPSISEIGSVNVIKIKRESGKMQLVGYNSDIKGITDSVMPYIGNKVKTALVFGSGGGSNAVRYALEKLGLVVTVTSRNPESGQISYSGLTKEIIESNHILVNTTPLGMFPNVDTKPQIDYTFLNNRHILFDLVYNPEVTAFLKAGQEQGCKIITGLKMLYSQAERSWEIWNNPEL